ncbi:hypothetical protein MEO93_07325 [Dolichospermum sp. ST_sed3]|nr:hypothetical protein [Dolichospermum sp. ST_sed6]MDD1438548.1 hypothetical protein [Dolichospermum sp. ST_sed10]MDD1440169.1 hypothetical protein [Dolichospermum sp. ST_sed3]
MQRNEAISVLAIASLHLVLLAMTAIYEVEKASVEVYHLVDGKYEKMLANARGHYPISPMGVELGIQQDTEIPWLRWWNQDGEMLLTGNERAEQAEAIIIEERQQKEKLAAYLKSLGINPDQIP